MAFSKLWCANVDSEIISGGPPSEHPGNGGGGGGGRGGGWGRGGKWGGGGGGGGGGVSFPNISGLVLRLDPSTITGLTDGQNVTAWADSTANGNDAAEATNPPTYDDGSGYPHGLAGVRFDGVNERLVVPTDASIENGQATYVAVIGIRQLPAGNGASDDIWLWNKQNANPATIGARVDGTTNAAPEAFLRVPTLLTMGKQTNAASSTVKLQVHIMRYNGTRGLYQIAADGTIGTVEEEAGVGAIVTTSPNSLYIGKHPTTANGTIMERTYYDFLIYDNDIGDTAVQQLVDWANALYPEWDWAKDGGLFVSGLKNVKITTIGSTSYLSYVKADGVTVAYKTAPTSDPHNWTDQGDIFTAGGAIGSAQIIFDGSTWFLYYDGRSDGTIRLATGASLASLTIHGSSPILTGSGTDWEQYVRHPFVISPTDSHDGNWHMLYDGRDGTSISGVGAIGHATSSDGITWTRDAANNPVLSASGAQDWEANDVGEPSALWTGSTYRVFWSGFGLSSGVFPHHLGQGTSSDLTSITRSANNPLLPLAQTVDDIDNTAHTSPQPYNPGDGTFWMYHVAERNNGGIHLEQIALAHEK